MTTEGFNSLGTFQAQVMDTLWDLGGANIHQIRDPVLLTLPVLMWRNILRQSNHTTDESINCQSSFSLLFPKD
jgi:hypothetical protein